MKQDVKPPIRRAHAQRCPECDKAQLNTAIIIFRCSKASRANLPFMVCRHCKVVICQGMERMGGWKLWCNGEYVDPG